MKRQPYTGFTVKDVRRLRACCLCGRIGIYMPSNPMLEIPIVVCIHKKADVKRAQRTYWHPRCYVEEMSVRKLLDQLDRDELESIRMSDVSPYVLQKILAKFRTPTS